jgi:very-short-patch-repair endonuclease
MTPAENRIWYKILRNKTFHGLRFERQKQIGCYIVDFYCAKQKLAIEIDGDSHYSETASEYDKKRTERLKSLGVTVVRYTNKEIMENLDGVFIDLETTLGLKE